MFKFRPSFAGIGLAPFLGMERQELEARSLAFAVAVKELCEELRQQPIAWNTAAQLLDASTSMSANYRATSRARSRPDWNSKIGVVAEEADEAVHWLEFVLVSKLSSEQRVRPLLKEAKELRAIFAASAATSRRNTKRRRAQ
jgi:four helix bundle protein